MTQQIVPEEFLREMEVRFFAKSDQKFEVVKRSGGLTFHPAPAHVNDKASLFLEDPLKLKGKWHEPRHMVFSIHVAVFFLALQSKRR